MARSIQTSIQTDLISMDFAKAFDTVPHCRLLYKLQWYGIQGKVHTWIALEIFYQIDHKQLYWEVHNPLQYQ